MSLNSLKITSRTLFKVKIQNKMRCAQFGKITGMTGKKMRIQRAPVKCSCSIQQSSCYTCYTEDSCRPAIIDSCQKQLSQISFHALSFQKI